jgi:hypothetical protein
VVQLLVNIQSYSIQKIGQEYSSLLLDPPDQQVLWALQEILDPQAHRVILDLLETLDPQAHRVIQDQLEI